MRGRPHGDGAKRANVLPGLRYLISEAGGTSGSRLRDFTIKVARLHQRDRWRFSIARRLPGVDGLPLDRPIFFLGAQGAGETIAGRCLRRHPAVVTVSGNSDSWTGTDELGIVRNRMARLPRTLWGGKHRTDLDHPVYGRDHNSVYACDELLPLYRSTGVDATDRDAHAYRRLLREHIRVYARDPRAVRFLDKTHTNTLKMPLIEALLDGCDPIFVLVVRNPYSWVHRAVRRKPPSYRRVPPLEDQLRVAAEHWENSYRTALEDGAHAEHFLVIRFEDFVADPESSVRRLAEATGLAVRDEMVPRPGDRMPFATLPSDRKWYPLFSDPWLAHVTELEVEIVSRRCAELAQRLGYTPDGHLEALI